jgi:hypothetical protein
VDSIFRKTADTPFLKLLLEFSVLRMIAEIFGSAGQRISPVRSGHPVYFGANSQAFTLGRSSSVIYNKPCFQFYFKLFYD